MYRSYGVRYLGPIAPGILVAKDDFETNLLYSAFEHARWAEEEARFLPGEYSIAALAGHRVLEFVESGPTELVGQGRWDSVFLRSSEAGLEATQSDVHLGLLKEISAFIDADQGEISKIFSGEYYAELEQRLFPFEERLSEINSDTVGDTKVTLENWIRASGEVVVVNDLEKARKRLIKRNRLYKAREETPGSRLQTTRTAFAVLEDIARQLEKRAASEIGEVQVDISAKRLSDFVLGGDPVPVICWTYAKYPLREALERWKVTRNDAEMDSHQVVIVSAKGSLSPRAMLFFRQGRECIASLPLNDREFRSCSMGLL